MRSPILLLALAVLALPARAATPSRLVDEHLGNWRVAEAAALAQAHLREAPEDPAASFLAARVAFYESDYARARDLARQAAAGSARDPVAAKDAAEMVAYLDERAPIWESFEEHRSAHFVVRVTPHDRILAPYALEALEASVVAMKQELGFEPTRPVIVEFYPSRRSFIAASTLTREEVETSGTLAICHFNRIMMISPAVLARGFEWLDALCHEYIHYSVYSLGGSAIPVWLHEGIAKHLETRWRVDKPEPLNPRMSSVLAEGIETGKWVTFPQMHPSMAKLPSAPLVSMAFSEVAVTVEMLRAQRGQDAVPRLIASLRSGSDMDASLRSLFSVSFAELEGLVKAHAIALKLPRVPGLAVFDGKESDEKPPWLAFADEGETPNDPEAEARRLEDWKSQDFTLLADRLKGRRFYDAAVVEYDKALERLGQSEPLVVNKKAHALLLSGKTADALAALEESLRWAPGLAVTLDNLAEAHLQLARATKTPEAAEAHYRAALDFAKQSERLNPFSIDTHVRLVRLLDRFGQPEAAARARERISLLRQQG